MSALDQMLRPLRDRVQMMLARGVVAGVDAAASMQALQVDLLDAETHDGVEQIEPYGLTAHPLPGAEVMMVAVGGLRSHGIVIAVGDRRYRLTGLSAGEVALHDDQGQKVHLTRAGIVIESALGVAISTDGAMTLDADSLVVTASTIELASDDVRIGNGAALFAARKTDAVAGSAITGGSTKVRIA